MTKARQGRAILPRIHKCLDIAHGPKWISLISKNDMYLEQNIPFGERGKAQHDLAWLLVWLYLIDSQLVHEQFSDLIEYRTLAKQKSIYLEPQKRLGMPVQLGFEVVSSSAMTDVAWRLWNLGIRVSGMVEILRVDGHPV